jgi:DNA modification methylase
MAGEKVDMVFTDPPYGIDEETDRVEHVKTFKKQGIAKKGSYSKIVGDTSIDTAVEVFSLIDGLNVPIVVYWGGNYYAHELPNSPCWVVWDKRVEDGQRDLNSDCELAWVKHPHKASVRIFRHLWKVMIKGSEHGQGRVHPTQKPIALAEWAFAELDPKGKSVLDLFLGSGSTLIACEKTNRKCYGMEIDPHYCDVIIKRWEDFTGNKAVLSGE